VGFQARPKVANLGRLGIGAEAPGRRNMPRIAGLAVALLMVLGFAIPAAAGENSNHDRDNSTLFATGRVGTVLLTIDVERGTTKVIGRAHPPGSLALAITPDGTAAYTIANFGNASAAQLARIDLATGAETLVVGSHPIGVDLKIMGMTFGPNGVLYAGGDFDPNSPHFNSLYKINLSTGAATRVGSFGKGPPNSKSDFIMSFAFDSDGNMYGASMMALYRIHLPRTTDARGGEAQSQEAGQGAEALATKVRNFSGSAAVMGIAIGGDGSFYAADFPCPAPNFPLNPSTIYAVNIENGVLTPLNPPLSPSIACVHNIAFSPEQQRGHHD
jgi:hypothetical protein